MKTPIEEVKERIAAEPDVKRVLDLAPAGDRYRYLIETPFETFPKFVIGTTDFDLKDVRIVLKCGKEWGAREAWEGGHEMP